MIVKKISTGLLGVNSYFLINEKTNKAVLIDGGENYNQIKNEAKRLGIVITDLLLTHAHFDHCGNAKEFQDDGVKVYCSETDNVKLVNGDTLGKDFGRNYSPLTADYLLKDGERVVLNGIEILALLTPGHTSGSMCFIAEDNLFSGDTVFYGTYGRVDFPSGSFSDMKKSCGRLFGLEKDYKVFPGHGEETVLSYEKIHNEINYD